MRRPVWFLVAAVPVVARAPKCSTKSYRCLQSLLLRYSAQSRPFSRLGIAPWLLAVIFPPLALLFGWHLSEFFEPSVGQAMVAEGGAFYLIASWGGALAVLVGCALGFAARGRHGKVDA